MITMWGWAVATAAFFGGPSAEAAVEPPELRADVASATSSRPGTFDQGRAQLRVALAGLSGAVLSGGFVVSRTQPSPGGQVRGAREAGHVDADFGDDDLGGALTDPRDRVQQLDLLGERETGFVDAGVQPGDHVGQAVDVLEV